MATLEQLRIRKQECLQRLEDLAKFRPDAQDDRQILDWVMAGARTRHMLITLMLDEFRIETDG